MPWICNWSGRAGNGSRGATGGTPEPAEHGALADSGEIQVIAGTAVEIAKGMSLAWFRMTIHEAELAYINGQIEKSSDLLMWLDTALDSPPTLQGSVLNPQEPIAVDGAIQDEVNALRLRVRALLIQIAQGLDFYGYYPGHVPLASLVVYRDMMKEMLAIADRVESAYELYYQNDQDSVRGRLALEQAISALSQKAPTLEQQAQQLVKEITDTRDQVQALLGEQVLLQVQVTRADEDFRNAVAREAACGLGDVIKAASAVVAIASGVGTIAGGLAAAGAVQEMVEAKKVRDSLKGRVSYLTKEVKVIGGGLSKIKSGYDTISGLLEEDRDAAKLVTSESEFEDTVKQFEHLEEARRFRHLMRQFLATVKARNTQILHADALLTRLHETDTESALLQLEIDNESAMLLEFANPFLVEHVTFFERAITRIRADVLRGLAMEHRALSYWTLREQPMGGRVTDQSVAHLQALHASFLSRYLRSIEDRNAAPQRFEGPLEFVFKRSEHTEMFERLDKLGRVTFTLPVDLPQYRMLSMVLVEIVRLRLKGLPFQQAGGFISAKLTHHGDASFVDRLGKTSTYRHRRRVRFAFFQEGSETMNVDLGGLENTYAYLSPFATWSLEIDRGENNDLNLSSIDEIGIWPSGMAYARYSDS